MNKRKKISVTMYALIWNGNSIQNLFHTRAEANCRRNVIAKGNADLKKAIKISKVLVSEL